MDENVWEDFFHALLSYLRFHSSQLIVKFNSEFVSVRSFSKGCDTGIPFALYWSN